MKSVQYLLVGLPYSGKTTLANELVNRLNFANINIDVLKKAKGYGEVSDDDVPDKIWDEIFKEADELIAKYLTQGKNVVNEYAWITKEWRNRAKKVAEDADFETKIIYLDIPIDIIWKRWEENENSSARFHLSKGELEKSIKEFEPLSQDENFIVYGHSESVADWIETNLA